MFLLACQVEERSPHTIGHYLDCLRSLYRWCHTNHIESLSIIDTNIMRAYFLSLKSRVKPTSVQTHYRGLHRFFNWLVEEHTIPEEQNPMRHIKLPKAPEPVIVPFNLDHIHRLETLFSDGSFLSVRNRAIMLVFVDTGVRLSELAAMKLTDVDFKTEMIKVLGKGAKERFVSIGKGAQRALLKYLLLRHDDCSYLWVTDRGTPLKSSSVYQWMRKAAQRAGITGVRCSPHTFRHTWATWSLELGASRSDVQTLLGHASDAMTNRYVKTVRNKVAVRNQRQFSPVDNLISGKQKRPWVSP